MKYRFEGEGSRSLVEKIWKSLEQQYDNMLDHAEKYNLVIDETLDTFDKFVELFDNEYYNCGDFHIFKCPVADYTLLVDKVISEDSVIFLPNGLANQFNVLELERKHYNPITGTYFDSLITNYLEHYHLLMKEYGDWICLEIENFITDNSLGKEIAENKMDYDKATTKALERKQLEENMKANLVKQLKIIMKEYNSVLSDEDIETIEDIINKYE